MVTISALNSALAQMQTSGGFDFSVLIKGGRSGSAPAVDGGSVAVALQQAEKNEAKQLAQVSKSPLIQKDLARYAKVVKSAKTIDDVLNDPIARKVFMKANGLGAHVDAIAMAKKAIKSDPTDGNSLANKLASTNGAWMEVATKFNFPLFGLTALKTTGSLKEVSDDYIAELRLDQLDQQVPGLGSAVLFKSIAKNLDTAIKILGSGLGREVVTTALGLPKQIALQSLDAQVKAVEQRLDPKKLQDEEFVNRLVQRYLIQLNGGAGGVTA